MAATVLHPTAHLAGNLDREVSRVDEDHAAGQPYLVVPCYR
jgi:hypothetical protein